MGDTFRKVKSGDKLRIPAATYNAFIDTALDFQSRQRNVSSTTQTAQRSSGIILVRNDTGTDLNRYCVLGVGGPIITPDANLDSFKNKMAVVGVVPNEEVHVGKYVISFDPLISGVIGMAYGAGVCPVRIDVPDEDHEYPYAEIVDGETAHLQARHQGSAAILWRQGGTGVQWALVRLGLPMQVSVFAVDLTRTGGSQGDEQSAATWTYDVTDPLTHETLAEGVDPVQSPHLWRRPSVGYVNQATAGYAHYNKDDQLVLGWINEVMEQAACEESGS